MSLSLIIPVFNEPNIENYIKEIIELFNKSTIENWEIILIDDHSEDEHKFNIKTNDKVKLLINSDNKGYGSSIIRGISISKYDLIGIIDGDETYPIYKIFNMYEIITSGNTDMIVGRRILKSYKESLIKRFGRMCLKLFAEYISGTKIEDINSGMRIFKKKNFIKYNDKLSRKFSFTSSMTIAHNLDDKIVKYLPIDYSKRPKNTKSNVNYFRDTLRTIQSMTKVSLFFNPIKIFLLPLIFYIFLILLFVLIKIFFQLDFSFLFISSLISFFILILFNFILFAELISVNSKSRF